jgi:hypothetical protein
MPHPPAQIHPRFFFSSFIRKYHLGLVAAVAELANAPDSKFAEGL